MLYTNRRRAGSFGEDAELYDQARPSYPPALIDRLLRDRPTSVLDVGTGTGIAARLLLERGVEVLGLEPDPRMAAIARRSGLAVEEGTLEAWDSRGRQFDLLTSAQAWHWVDPVVGALKAQAVLRSGGRIGLFWNFGEPQGGLGSRIDAVYASITPELEDSVLLGRGQRMRTELAAESLAAAGDWDEPSIESFGWDRTYQTADWTAFLQTHSDHRTLPADKLAELLSAVAAEIDGVGGSFVLHYETILVTAVKAADGIAP